MAGTDTCYRCSVTSQGWKSILECWGSSQRAAHLLDMESMVCAPCASRYQCILREKHNLPQLMICKHCSHRITSSQTTSQFITSAVRVFFEEVSLPSVKIVPFKGRCKSCNLVGSSSPEPSQMFGLSATSQVTELMLSYLHLHPITFPPGSTT